MRQGSTLYRHTVTRTFQISLFAAVCLRRLSPRSLRPHNDLLPNNPDLSSPLSCLYSGSFCLRDTDDAEHCSDRRNVERDVYIYLGVYSRSYTGNLLCQEGELWEDKQEKRNIGKLRWTKLDNYTCYTSHKAYLYRLKVMNSAHQKYSIYSLKSLSFLLICPFPNFIARSPTIWMKNKDSSFVHLGMHSTVVAVTCV